MPLSKTGEKLWEYEYPESWFRLPTGVNIPDAARWLVTVQGYTGGGGGGSSDYDDAMRTFSPEQLSGDDHFAPYPPEVIHQDGQSIAVVVAGMRRLAWICTQVKKLGLRKNFLYHPFALPS